MGSAQPLVIETQQSGAFHLEVAEVIAETHDSRSLVLRVPAELQERFRYKPGQYLGFRVALGGKRLTRCYSMSSSPDCDALPKVTIKRVDGGRVSNWFNDQVHPGDRLEVLPPAGHFHLRPGEHDLVLFGGGSGITPVFSILKSALQTSARRIKLVYANRDEASVIFRDELRAIARAQVERLEVVHVLDSVQGFLDEGQVRQLVRGHAGAEFYICGPGPFMDTVERALLGLGRRPRASMWSASSRRPTRTPASPCRCPMAPPWNSCWWSWTAGSPRCRCSRGTPCCKAAAPPVWTCPSPARRASAAPACARWKRARCCSPVTISSALPNSPKAGPWHARAAPAARG